MKQLENVEFGSTVEIIDPSHKSFQKSLDEKAMRLVDGLLDEGLEENDIREKATALNAYTKFKTMQQNDSLLLLDKITQMSDKQIEILEKALKQKNVLEKVKAGDFLLEDIYDLSKKKRLLKKKKK